MARIRLTAPAKRDIGAVLERSRNDFGTLARRRYEALILAALQDLSSSTG